MKLLLGLFVVIAVIAFCIGESHMWVVVSVFILMLLGVLSFIILFADEISDCIHAKADELRARAELIRHEFSCEQNEKK
ncbi:MAG: hypothetical protein IJP85_05760 [Synergistaceae bacterium]|nr:hypothetical protein [Synergistaceae bacterium]